MFSSNLKRLFSLLPVLVLASVAPNAFPAAQLGYASLHDLAIYAMLPALAGLALLMAWSWWKGDTLAAQVILVGGMAGAVATLALEAVRYPGFRLGFMPGNLPELMGVLLLDRFVLGPSTASNVAGFAYHFWNGACFGIIFVALERAGLVGRSWIWSAGYGILIGVGFLASPVVESLGVGLFGVNFGWKFAATVLTAHAAFGLALGYLVGMAYSFMSRCACELPLAGGQGGMAVQSGR